MLRKRYLQKLMTTRLCFVFIHTRTVEVIYLDISAFLASIELSAWEKPDLLPGGFTLISYPYAAPSPNAQSLRASRIQPELQTLGEARRRGRVAMDVDALAKAFVQHYYQTFDSNRAGLAGLYQDGSMLTFEGEKFLGGAAIASKIRALPFQQCQHKIDTVDCQPSGPQGGVLVFVSGTITLGPGEHPLKFSQMFHLLPAGGSFYVQNDMFRLNYG